MVQDRRSYWAERASGAPGGIECELRHHRPRSWFCCKTLPGMPGTRTSPSSGPWQRQRCVLRRGANRCRRIENRLRQVWMWTADAGQCAKRSRSGGIRIKNAAEEDIGVVEAPSRRLPPPRAPRSATSRPSWPDLRWTLREKKIKVDDATDQALVRGFAAQLGKDGQ